MLPKNFKDEIIIVDVDIGEEMEQQNNEFASEDDEEAEIVVDAEETGQLNHGESNFESKNDEDVATFGKYSTMKTYFSSFSIHDAT